MTSNDIAKDQATVSVEQRCIDDQISQLHTRIRSLKTERNTYSRISRIPAEIISDIFVLAKWASQDARRRRHLLDDVDDSRECNWLNIAGVCTYWREIALDCPYLWSTITLTPVDRAIKMIERTKSAPLFISCSTLGSPGLDEISSIVMSNIHRIRELDVAGIDSDKLFEFLRMNQGASAPILQVLNLKGPIVSLPKDILERSMGSLQELNLVDGTLTFPIPPFPQLRRLLVNPPEHDASRLSLDVLLESLRNTPNIEGLRVHQVHVPDDTSTNANLSVVHLPRLSRLDISGLAIQSSKLLSLLEHPHTANITYRCEEANQPGSDLSDLQNALIRFASLPGRVICGVSVEIVESLSMFGIVLDTILHSSSHSFVLTLRHVSKDDFTQLLSTVHFSKAKALNLSCVGDIIRPPHLLGLCDNVEALTLTDCPVAVFRGLLKTGHLKLPLPKLRTLAANRCRIYDPYEVDQDASMCHGAMLSVLKQRTQLEMGIKELTIRECDITKDIVDKYRKYVKVDWDGHEIDDEDETESEEGDDLFF